MGARLKRGLGENATRRIPKSSLLATNRSVRALPVLNLLGLLLTEDRRMTKKHAPIFLVDDNLDTRVLLRTRLEMAGYSVVEAANGKEALELLTGGVALEPCLIMLDLEMPVMSGWEFLAIINRYSRLAEIPVLVVSGRVPLMAHVEAIAHKAIVAAIQKPFDMEKLVATVAQHARKHGGAP